MPRKSALKYKIVRKICNIRGKVVMTDPWGNAGPLPRIEGISWSTGARDWTLKDAGLFFQAGLDLLEACRESFDTAKADKGGSK